MQCSPQPISTQLKTLSKYSLFSPTSSLSTSTITLLCTIETQAIRIFCLSHQGHTSPLKPKMHIEYFPYLEKIYKSQPPISTKCINFPIFLFILRGFCLIYVFLLPSILTMLHFCIMLYMYWTPLTECTISRDIKITAATYLYKQSSYDSH